MKVWAVVLFAICTYMQWTLFGVLEENAGLLQKNYELRAEIEKMEKILDYYDGFMLEVVRKHRKEVGVVKFRLK